MACTALGADHGHTLHYHGHSVVHRLPAHVKVVAALTFVGTVVAAPRGAWTAYLALAGVLAVAVALTRVPPSYLLARMLIEAPVVVFAAILPFVSAGERTTVAGLSVSTIGLVSAGTIVAKATLGTVAALLLATTTEARDLVVGLQRLRLPGQLVAILGFMIRYVDVVTDQLRRMRMAQTARGFHARSWRSWRVLASTGGALFVRSYERGERVHLAMLSRGYQGTIPYADAQGAASAATWARAMALPAVAAAITVVTVLTTRAASA
jgi:cobalt/nickel transport system permease protein